MAKFRQVITYIFLFSALIIFLLIAVLDYSLYVKVFELIKEYIWPAAIAGIVFLVLLLSGVFSNMYNPESTLFRTGYFQLAMLLFFLMSAGVGGYYIYLQQPGQIVLQLAPGAEQEFVNLVVRYQSNGQTTIDTVTAPNELTDRPAGHYIFETYNRDIVYFSSDLQLDPLEMETLIIPVVPNVRTLTIRTDPPGAEVLINGIQASQTPDSFDILTGDTIDLELKMKGYQSYVDTLDMTEDVDLGEIRLRKIYALHISCKYSDIEYSIYDQDGKIVFTGQGSRNAWLAEGSYRVSYGIGEGQYESKRVSLNRSTTVMIP